MLVNNYWNFVSYFASHGINSGGEWVKINVGVKGLDGTTVQIQLARGDVQFNYYGGDAYIGARSGLGLRIGTGTTDPVITDYCLTTDVTSSFSSTSVSSITGADGASIKTVLTFTGVNTSGADITLTEYGIIKAVPSSSAGSTTPVLWMHELFSEPIVVPAGSSITIPIEWTEQ